MRKNNKKGFTLAELLIVVAIIAVLVAIAIPVFTSQLEKAARRLTLPILATIMLRSQLVLSIDAYDACNYNIT